MATEIASTPRTRRSVRSIPSWPQAWANIVSPDQHWTGQSGGTFMQRTIFHLQGLTTARDALERDFAEQVAVRFNMHFGLTEASKPKPVAIIASKGNWISRW